MNPFQAAALVMGTSSIFLAAIACFGGSRQRYALIFMASAVITGLSLFLYAFLWWTPDPAVFKALYSIEICATLFGLAFNLLFSLEFTHTRLPAAAKAGIFIPAVVLTAASLVSGSIFADFAWRGDRWHTIPSYGSVWILCHLAVNYVAYPLIFLLRLRSWSKKSPLEKDKSLARVWAVSYPLFLLGGLFTDFLLPLTGADIPPVGPLFYSLHIAGLFYCIVKYKFLVFDLRAMSDVVVSSINDYVVVLDRNCAVVSANARFEKRVPEANGAHLADILVPDERSTMLLCRLFEGDSDNVTATLRFQSAAGTLTGRAECSRIKNDSDDFLGALFIIKETLKPRDLGAEYGFTERQLEIIDLILQGMSNAEISDALNLSRRTVETHISAVYNKLQVKNRPGLIRKTKGYFTE